MRCIQPWGRTTVLPQHVPDLHHVAEQVPGGLGYTHCLGKSKIFRETAGWLLTGAFLRKRVFFKQYSLQVIPKPGGTLKRYQPAGTMSCADKKTLKHSRHPWDSPPCVLDWEATGVPEFSFRCKVLQVLGTSVEHRRSDFRKTGPTSDINLQVSSVNPAYPLQALQQLTCKTIVSPCSG